MSLQVLNSTKRILLFTILLNITVDTNALELPTIQGLAEKLAPTQQSNPILTNVASLGGASLHKAVSSLTEQEREEASKTESSFRDLCLELLKLENIGGNLVAAIEDQKKELCKRIALNTGRDIKNRYLGLKMMGIFADPLLQKSLNYNDSFEHLVGLAGNLNTEIINSLKNKRQECFSATDNCRLKTVFINAVKSDWVTKRKDAVKTLTTHIEATTSIGIKLPEMDTAGRMLEEKGTRNRVRKREIDLNKKLLKKKIAKKIDRIFAKYTPNVSRLSPVLKEAFKIKEETRLAISMINEQILRYREMPKCERTKYFSEFKFNLKRARRSCMKKFGKKECIKMCKVAYCYACPDGYETYWRTKRTCGCRLTSDTIAHKLMVYEDLLRQAIEEEEDDDEISQREEELAKFMRQHMKITSINDAFFYRVEDYYVIKSSKKKKQRKECNGHK